MRAHYATGASIGALVASLVVHGGAFAQETVNASTPDRAGQTAVLEEVVVTARKREESLQSVPVAVTAIAGEALEEQGGTNITDMQGLVPNLVIEEGFGNTGNAIIFIRGIGVQENERYVDPAVGVVIDGVFLGNSRGALVNTFDFESVEVLRGPQGTLFGKNTTGGVLNIRRARPASEFGGRFELTAGSFNRLDAKATINVPLVQDRLEAKLTVVDLNNDYHARSLQRGGRIRGDDITDVVFSLAAHPSETVDLLLTYQHQRDRSLTPATLNLSGTGNPVNPGGEIICTVLTFCGPFDGGDTFGGTPFYNDNRQDNVSLEATWDSPIGTFTSVTGYREAEDRQQSDTDSVPASVFGVQRNYDFSQISEELRLDTEVGERIDLTTGVFFFADDIALKQDIVDLLPFFGAPAGSEVQLQTAQERTAAAIFAQADIEVTETLSLTVGGRYSTEEKKFRGSGGNFINGLGFVPTATSASEDSWTEFTPKLGANWQATPNILAYYSYSKGFRSGGYNGRNFTPASIGPFDQESVTQHEAGLKMELFERSLRLNLAAFNIKYEDKQEEVIQADPVQGSSTVTTNASDATLNGAEAEFTWITPAPGLTLSGNIGYLDASYDEFCADLDGPFVGGGAGTDLCGPAVAAAGGVLAPVDNSGLRLRRSPELQYGLTATYERDLGPGRLNALLDYAWSDEYFQDVRNDPRGLYQAEGRLDASLAYTYERNEDRTLTVTVFGRNLTDERQNTGFAVAPPFVAIAIRTEPRTYGVSLSGTF